MSCGDSTIPPPEKQIVFTSAEPIFRIPALICLNKEDESKTLLAFAEQRKTPDDASTEKLVMRKGEVKDESCVKTVKWSELKVVENAHIDGYRPMNPCPVYDKVKNKLFLFFICVKDGVTEKWQKKCYCNKARLCYITSTDFGETWRGVTDLTDELPDIKNWATFAVGPGHGIQTQTKENKYKLIVPVHACYSTSSKCCVLCCYSRYEPKQYALSLYSNDSGDNWTFGKMFETKSGECEMAEISENVIYCNARSENSYRVEAFSNDNGVSFSENRSAKKLLEISPSGCQGSVISFPAQDESANADRDPNPNKWLLFTHPTSESHRTDLGVYLNNSPCDPTAWSKTWIINDGPSGYSDLAYINDGWFACLFECGKDKIHEQIAFKVFSYNEVKNHTAE